MSMRVFNLKNTGVWQILLLGILVFLLMPGINNAYGESHPLSQAVISKVTLARQAYEAKHYTDAERYLKEVLHDQLLSADLKQQVTLLLIDTLQQQRMPEKIGEAITFQAALIKSRQALAKTPDEWEQLCNYSINLASLYFVNDNMSEAALASQDSLAYLVKGYPVALGKANPKQEKYDIVFQNLLISAYQLRTQLKPTELNALATSVDKSMMATPGANSANLIEFYVQPGLQAFKDNQQKEAFYYFDRAYKIAHQLNAYNTPNWPAVLECLGRSAQALGQYPVAVQAYKELLALKSAGYSMRPEQIAYYQSQIRNLSSIDPGRDYFYLQGKDITRWNDKTKTIMVYIPTGEMNSYWKPSYRESLQQAFLEWQEAMQNRVQFVFTENPKKYDVKIIWANRKNNNPSHPPNQMELGYNMTETWGEFIAKSDIYLFLDKGAESLNDDEFYKTALHEIGHLLGIHVHSNHYEDVMFPIVHVSPKLSNHLTQRDIATMRKLYETKPGITNPNGYVLSEFEKFRKKQMADLECDDAPIITLNFDLPGAYGGQQHRLVCRKKQRPQDQIPVWMPSF